MDRTIGIGDLQNLEKFLNGEPFTETPGGPIYYVEEIKTFIVDQSKIYPYKKAPELTGPRFIQDMHLLEAMAGKYIPILDRNTKELLYTREAYEQFRKRMSGLKEYGTGDYIFADKLSFNGLDYYLDLYDKNVADVDRGLNPVVREFKRVMDQIGLTVTLGANSGGDLELIETGSTSRYTNIPSVGDVGNWDFDFVIRMDPDKVLMIRQTILNGFNYKGQINSGAAYRVRLTEVSIPGLENPLDLDFSFMPQKKHYLSTELSLSERLENMRGQDEERYRLVVANIQFAKAYLKEAGVYKPSRSLPDKRYGGLGGVGIENWVLQYGGSFEAAARDFLAHAEGKTFIEFEKEYPVLDFGKDHVSVSKGDFPYDNFVMRNMRELGFERMREALKKFILEVDEGKRNTL